MGNQCCNGRVQKVQEHIPKNKSRPKKPKKIPQIEKAPYRRSSTVAVQPLENMTKIISDNSIDWSPDSHFKQSPSLPRISLQRSASQSQQDQLYYSLQSLSNLPKSDLPKILTLLKSYEHEFSIQDQQSFDSLLEITQKVNNNIKLQRTLLLCTHSFYIVNSKDLSDLHRRIRIENIDFISIQKNMTSGVFHINRADLAGDFWVSTYKLKHLILGIQNFHKYITQKYIPTSTVQRSILESRFNKFPSTLLSSFHTPQMLKVTDLLISMGSLGENVLYLKKSVKFDEKKGDCECYVMVTDCSLYFLSLSFSLLQNFEFKAIQSASIADSMNKVIVDISDHDIVLFLPTQFLTNLEKAYSQALNKRLAVQILSEFEMTQYIKSKTSNFEKAAMRRMMLNRMLDN